MQWSTFFTYLSQSLIFVLVMTMPLSLLVMMLTSSAASAWGRRERRADPNAAALAESRYRSIRLGEPE